MTTQANVNGANITRLSFQQMHTNTCQCVLAQPPVTDAESNKYIVAVERLVVSTDIPIYEKGTVAFYVLDLIQANGVPYMELENFPAGAAPADSRQCVVGPVYSFSDFIHQVQSWCERYNRDATLGNRRGVIAVDSQAASRKVFGLRGNNEFWSHHILQFSEEFGRVFQGLFGGDGNRHNYLFYNNGNAAVTKRNLHNGVTWNRSPHLYMYLDEDGDTIDWDEGEFATLEMPCKLDMFENRVGLQIDSVLPLPLEMFCLNSNATERNKGKTRYNFLTLDFPEGELTHTARLGGSTVSDDIDITQTVRTGLFQLVPNSHNSVAKKLLAGSLQSQRYELLLIRKVPQADNSISLVPEPVKFSNGDFWSMDVVFTKQI